MAKVVVDRLLRSVCIAVVVFLPGRTNYRTDRSKKPMYMYTASTVNAKFPRTLNLQLSAAPLLQFGMRCQLLSELAAC